MNEERKTAIEELKRTSKARINEEQRKKLEERTTKQEIKRSNLQSTKWNRTRNRWNTI